MKSSLKKTLLTVTFLSAGGFVFAQSAEAASFFAQTEADPVVVNKDAEQYNVLSDVKDNVNAAMELHKTAGTFLADRKVLQGYKDSVEMYNEIKNRLQQNIQCNETSLKEHFSDGETVWKNVSAWAEDSASKLLAKASDALNTDSETDAGLKALEKKADSGDFSDTGANIKTPVVADSYGTDMNLDELAVYAKVRWDVGYQVLKDLYASPEKWGSVKKPFSIWQDQRYSYNAYLKDKYTQMTAPYNTKNASLPAVPQLSDSDAGVPSDYFTGTVPQNPTASDYSGKTPDARWCGKGNTCERINKGTLYAQHVAYVTALKQLPLKLGQSTPDMSAPYLPSVPLPPWRESVYILGVNKELPELGSELPEPWARIVQNINYFSSKGEMANLVEKKGNTVRFRPGDYDAESGEVKLDKKGNPKLPIPLSTNRISAYLSLKDALTQQEPVKERAEASIKEMGENVLAAFAKAGYQVENPESFDLAKDGDYNTAVRKFTELQKEKIEAARQKIAELKRQYSGKIMPSVQQILDEETRTIKAMEKDKEFLVDVTRSNAADIDSLIKTAVADRVANETYQTNLDQQMEDMSPVPAVGCPVL